MSSPSEEQTREFDCENGFVELRRLQASYDRFIVGLKRQMFTGGRSTLSQMIGGLEMTPDAILAIEESTRRWCGGGTYYATIHNSQQQPLMRLRYEIIGEPRQYRGPGSDQYKDEGNDTGVVHLPSKRHAEAALRNPAPIAAAATGEQATVQILDRALQQTAAQRTEEQQRRDRETADLRRELSELRNQHTQTIAQSARERAEAEQRRSQEQLTALQEELRELRRQREAPPPARTPTDWVGVATAIAAPLATIVTAIVSAGTERHKTALTVQRQPETRGSIIAELKELMALPIAKPLVDKLFGETKAHDDRIAMIETMAEQSMSNVMMWRDVMRELEPKGEPVAVQVTRMVGETLGQIAQHLEQIRRGGKPQQLPAQQQQAAPEQAQQQQPAAEVEHRAEVVEPSEPAADTIEAAYANFPDWMKTREWQTVLREAWAFDRKVIRSEQIDMVAQLAVDLIQHGVRYGMLPPELGAPNEELLQELAEIIVPWNEDHATALVRALTRLFAMNKKESGPSIVTPRPQERIGSAEPGQVVPIR